MTKIRKKTAKRKLANITFEHQGAHVALVCDEQGGPANGHDYSLVLKSANMTEEYINKMQQVQVTMELPEFLQRMFGMYYEDAQVLATFLGYVEGADDTQGESEPQTYQDYIQSKVDAFTVLKGAHEAEDLQSYLSTLTQEQFLSLVEGQATVEKAFAEMDNKSDESTQAPASAEASDTSIASEVNKSEESASNPTKTLENSSMNENQVEMVEKAVLVDVQKALTETQELLKAAQETIAQYEAKAKEAVETKRLETLKATVKDDTKADTIFKAIKDSSDEDFEVVVKALAEMQEAVEKSALFQEAGATGSDEGVVVQESAVAKVIKAKLNQ